MKMSKSTKKSTSTHRSTMQDLTTVASDLGNEFALVTSNSANSDGLALSAKSAENVSAQIAGLQSMAGLTAKMMVRDVVAKVRERIRAIKDNLRKIDKHNEELEKAQADAEKAAIDAAVASVTAKTRDKILAAFADVWSVDEIVRDKDNEPEYKATIVHETTDPRGKAKFVELTGASLMRHLAESKTLAAANVKVRVIPRMMAIEFVHHLVEVAVAELEAMLERHKTLATNNDGFQQLEEMRANYEAEITPDRQAELQETFEAGTVLGSVSGTTQQKFQEVALKASDAVMRGLEDRIGVLESEGVEVVA